MIDLDAHITSLEQAEAYFKAMGCSHFHLSRESFERYDEYRALGVSKELESDWRIEEFKRHLSSIYTETRSDALWAAQSRLLALLPSLDDNAALSIAFFAKLLDATRHAAGRVVGRDRVILAETIIGRTAHRSDGMIVKAFALNQPYFAEELFATASQLLSFDDSDAELTRRKCQAIDDLRELKLEVSTSNPFALLEKVK